ncbi:DNA topoisomerase I-fused to SWI domain [Nitrosopumilus piranensis]|uniref:DNA topoisomerase I-fused to SWI domain n=1 Tax=Nitrosopumilus piranensis TaxID=1582439 RepID=A0A0C5BPM2_9ARCH|nr:DNA topoisomerase I-fused to SWI domain [Nitrosopumilus piranensis]
MKYNYKKLAVKKKTTKRKTTTKKKAAPKKKSTKSKAKKPAFGGYAISFAGRKETAEQIFGKKPIAPSEMTKKIWAFVKSKSLSNR